MDEKARQDMIDSLRRKVWGLRGLADLNLYRCKHKNETQVEDVQKAD